MLLGGLVVVLVVLLAVILALVALRSGPPKLGLGPVALPAPATPEFGANVNYLYNYFNQSAQEQRAQLAALAATGATVARTDSLWELGEPTAPAGSRHRYVWQFDDQIVATLAAAGLRWQPIVDYTVSWAASQPGVLHSPPSPDRYTAYGAYAAALAARYGPGGRFWAEHPGLPARPVQTFEIWNEPDNPAFWSPHPDPAAYAELYLAARNAIKSVQPGARVIVGGLLDAGPFVASMLHARPRLSSRIDGVAIHPYARTPAGVLASVAAARRELIALGMSTVPLYVTEFGWATQPASNPFYVPARTRPGYIEATLTALARSGCELGAIVLYTWITPERHPADREDWFGISPPAGGRSADVSAFAAGLRAGGEPPGASGSGC